MGFKKDYLLQPPPDDCVCFVCFGVLVDPRRLSPCGHTICVACIPSKQSHVKGNCPVCGIQLWRRPLKLPTSFTDRILSLESRCHLMCGFEGSLKQLPQHLAQDCPNSMVSCHNRRRGCVAEFLRCKMEEHLMKNCLYRVTSCDGCGKRLLFSKLQAHQARNKCVEAKLMNETIRSERRNSKEVRDHWLSMRLEQVALRSQLTRLRSNRLEARRRSLSAMTHAHKRERTTLSARIPKSQPTPRQQRSMSAPACPPDDHDFNNVVELSIPRNLPTLLQPINTSHWKDDSLSDVSDDISLIVPSEYSSGSFCGSLNVRKSVDGMMTDRISVKLESIDANIKCRQCGKFFKQRDNHERACCWHKDVSIVYISKPEHN